MRRFMQKAYRGQMAAYLEFFVLLLLVAALILVAMAISGCYCDESTKAKKETMADYHSPILSGPGSVPPGGRVDLWINPSLFVGKRTVRWTPPPGATNFQFPGIQPEPGGPPFEFKNVGEFTDLRMSYTAPGEPGTLVDTVTSRYADGSESSVSHQISVSGQSPAAAAPPAAPPIRQVRSPSATLDAWQVRLWLDAAEGVTLTTELCQEWATKMQSDEFFVAARMPMTTTAITGSYRLPFVFGSPYSQTLYLDDYNDPGTSPMLMTATLEYRPERLTFLANELPAAPGEHWAALGISSTEPVSCSTGLNSSSWGLRAELLLDLHDQPGACEGCTVRFYGCYEGQESPMEALGQRALARSLGIQSYQGQGITCLGPKPVHLEEYGANLHLGGTAAAAITPTQPITLHEYIDGLSSSTVTVTMDYSSTVRGWRFYGGDWTQPDLNRPISTTTEIMVPQYDLVDIWAVNNPVPGDTVAGPHSLVITVTSTTSPSLTTWHAIALWSGGWVAPPLPGAKYKVYLPLVLK